MNDLPLSTAPAAYPFLPAALTGLKQLQKQMRSQINTGRDLFDQFAEQVRCIQLPDMDAAEQENQPVDRVSVEPVKPCRYDRQQLEEFASGSMAAVFGSAFAVFEGRRHPRIPRGSLLLMDRILEIKGERGQIKFPAEITAEVDIPHHAWYLADYLNSATAIAALMEMALQPCGVLSAHLGTALVQPAVDFYFRNLDGSMTVSLVGDLRGTTIQSWAKLTSTIVSANTILQRFEFSLSQRGNPFVHGETVFGYFHPDAMAAQKGFSEEAAVPPHQDLSMAEPLPIKLLQAAVGQQRNCMLHEAYLKPANRIDKPIVLIGLKQIEASDWFFQDHFFQDPVMPGSLGVEAISQLLSLYVLSTVRPELRSQIRIQPAADSPLSWKYRGQILPADRWMSVRVRILEDHRSADGSQGLLRVSAEVWKDNIKIYEVNPFGFRVQPG